MQPEGAPILIEVRASADRVRRALDVLLIVIAGPFVLLVVTALAMLVKLDSPGPAFVRIQRLGRNGEPFGLLKLRSMHRDAEAMKESLRHLNTMQWPDFKVADDPRVTRVGRWLRRTSLDELPQLVHLLTGEITLVGPRPCSVKLADYALWQTERLEVTPGLVGRWQAEGRGRMTFDERCRLDIRQSQVRSLRVSVQLTLATLRSILTSRGAY